MANHVIPENVNFNDLLRMIETTDLVHANTMNPIFQQLIHNDVFIKKLVETLQGNHNSLSSTVTDHAGSSSNPHNVTASQVGAMPKDGGDFTGVVKAMSNNAYTTKQLRNITLSTGEPSGGDNGDIWIKYK